MKSLRLILSSLFLILTHHAALAEDATWNLNPGSGDWNTATNWTPNTVPGDADIATFNTSSITDITFSQESGILEILFNPGASSFTYTVKNDRLTVNAVGIINNSGVIQNFVADGETIIFNGNASAGSQTLFTTRDFGKVTFTRFATAGAGVFIKEGSPSSTGAPDQMVFSANGTAA